MRCQGLSRNITVSVAAPMAKAVQLAAPSSSASPICHRSSSGPSLSIEIPNSFGNWLISTVNAMPFM
jgi:hypothetical protein